MFPQLDGVLLPTETAWLWRLRSHTENVYDRMLIKEIGLQN